MKIRHLLKNFGIPKFYDFGIPTIIIIIKKSCNYNHVLVNETISKKKKTMEKESIF